MDSHTRRRTNPRRHLAIPFALFLAWLAPGVATALICGDADTNDQVSLTDGVQVLRAVAELPSACPEGPVCDVDGNGRVGLTDGIQILRSAAGLASVLTCGSPVADFVRDARLFGDVTKLFHLEPAPEPAANAVTTLGVPIAEPGVIAGTSAFVSLPVTLTPGAASLLVVVREADGTPLPGFFEIPITVSASQLDLELGVAATLIAGAEFQLAFATSIDGELSTFQVLPQRVLICTAIFCPFVGVCEGGPKAGAECSTCSATGGDGGACRGCPLGTCTCPDGTCEARFPD